MLVFVLVSVGSCICNDGYVGADCRYREDTRPEDLSLPDGGLCNKRASHCGVIAVFGDKFIASNNLTCHLQAVQVISGNTFQSQKKTGEILKSDLRISLIFQAKSTTVGSIDGL